MVEGFIVVADSHINRITELQFTVAFSNAKTDQVKSQVDLNKIAEITSFPPSFF